MEEDEEDEEPMEEDEEGTGEEDEGEDTGEETEKGEAEKAEKEGEKKDEEEEPSNLQLAREMLELAKLAYSKQLEAGAEAHLEERLVGTMLALGEVSIENENYKQAVEDIKEGVKKQGQFPKDAR